MSDDMGMMADCALCGKKHLISEMKEFCGELCCLSCLCANTFVCGCCHKRVARSEIATYDGDDIELWTDRDGERHYATEILANRVYFGDSRPKSENGDEPPEEDNFYEGDEPF